MNTKVRVLVATAILSLLVGGDVSRPGANASLTVFAAPSLTNLKDVEELKTLFNRDAGKVRLVLLVSPT